MKALKEYYKNKKEEIKNRLNDFKDNYKKGNTHVFSELCFCILTPQAEAVECDKAIKELKRTKLLFNGSPKSISPKLKSARFLNKKAEYIVAARRFFKRNGCIYIKKHINELSGGFSYALSQRAHPEARRAEGSLKILRRFAPQDEGSGNSSTPHINDSNIFKTREWLVRNIKGIGYKEASHFLRNIGFGRNLAILDVHILKNLKKYNVIKEIPKSITKAMYMEIEDKMREFSRKIKIPMDELDLLFWSKETGRVFK